MRPHRVAVLAFPPVPVFEMSVACEVFGIARAEMGVPKYDFRLCAADDSPLPPRHGFSLSTPHRLDSVRWADTVILPGWPAPTTAPPAPAVLEELRRAHRRGARLASFCSGSFGLGGPGPALGQPGTAPRGCARGARAEGPHNRGDPQGFFFCGR